MTTAFRRWYFGQFFQKPLKYSAAPPMPVGF
jgi:hypothetical protein